jgi:GntR family transcriptional regulator
MDGSTKQSLDEGGLVSHEVIDADSFTPAYLQLARIIHDSIMRGELKPGDRIPSEGELSDRFGLSRMTVRRAIATLAERELVRGEQGRGTFVIGPKVEGGVFLIPDFHEEMKAQGLDSTVKLLKVELVKAPGKVAENLGLRKGERVIYLERLMEAEGEPRVLDRKYILFDSSQPLLEAELGYGSSEELFAHNPDLVTVGSELSLSATTLRPREAELLASEPGSPAFCMEQLIFAANEQRLSWGWLIYRGDKFRFNSMGRLF